MARPYSVLVCGGRDYTDRVVVFRELEMLGLDTGDTIIEGCARGADRLAEEWGKTFGVKVDHHPAEWDRYGKSAGYRRNAEMVALKPDLVLAFPGGKGTANTIALARQAGLRVYQIEETTSGN